MTLDRLKAQLEPANRKITYKTVTEFAQQPFNSFQKPILFKFRQKRALQIHVQEGTKTSININLPIGKVVYNANH